MNRAKLAWLAAVWACGAACAAGAPVPNESKTVISAANVRQLRAINDVPKRADRIDRGPRNGELIILEWNGNAEIVNDKDFRTLRPLAKGHRPTDIAVSPDGNITVWIERNKSNYTAQETAGGKTFEIEVGDTAGYAAFDPASKFLAIGKTFWDPGAHGVGHSEVNLYDVSGKLLRTLEKTGPGAVRPVFSPDGKLLAVGNRNYQTRLFEVATGKLLHSFDKHMTHEIAFSPDGKILAAGYVNGSVALWDVDAGKLLHSVPSTCKEVYSVDWSPKGDLLVTSGLSGKIVLWEPKTLRKLTELSAPLWVIQVRFSADGTRLFSSSSSEHGAKIDRKIVVWSVPDEDKR